MDYFSYIIKCILRKIPIKLLLIILIVVLLSFICFNAKSYATTEIPIYDVGNTGYKLQACTNNSINWDTFISKTEYQSGLYNWIITTRNGWTCMCFWLKSYDVKFYNNGVFSSKYAVLYGGNLSQMPCIYYYYNADGTRTGNTGTSWDVNWNTDTNGSDTAYYLTNVPVYTDNTFTTMWWSGLSEPYTAPYITNTTGITNWSFNNLIISLGDEDYKYTEDGIGYEPTWWTLNILYQGHTYQIWCDNYTYEQDHTYFFIFPRNVLSNYFNLYNGNDISFSLTQYNKLGNNLRFKTFTLDTYTLNLTTADENVINADSDKQVMGSIDNNIHQVSVSVDNFYNSFNNTSVTPQLVEELFDTGEDITINDSSGIENFFLILYNAFCENQVVNVHVTIPFTNKTMTISSMEVSNHYPSALVSIMSIVSYGVICLFICRDIRKMVDKSLEGNVENISHDIKREVL